MATKKSTSTKRRANAGTTFSWHPRTFQDVVRAVHAPPTTLLTETLVQAIDHLGALECPSPAWDANGTFAVLLNANRQPEIQRFDPTTRRWSAAALGGPPPLPPLKG